MCPDRRTYFVVSPEIEFHPGNSLFPEPPEYGHAVQEVITTSKKAAKRHAIKYPNSDMQKWIQIARGDNKSPFQELKVEHPHCDHNICLDNCLDQNPNHDCWKRQFLDGGR